MSKKILLADDSLTIQKVVELTFMDEGFEVEAVGSGEDALSRLDEMDPDLVIADVHMPEPDGYGVCREVKRRSPATPVLLLVGTFQPFDEAEAEACGASGFLKKPFDSQELFRRVEELVAAPAQAVETVDEVTVSEVAASEDGEAEGIALEELETLSGAPLSSMPVDPVDAPAAPEPAVAPVSTVPQGGLSDEDVDRIARRVAEMLGQEVLREVSWEVVPDLAEIVIKDRLRDLESQLD